MFETGPFFVKRTARRIADAKRLVGPSCEDRSWNGVKKRFKLRLVNRFLTPLGRSLPFD